MKFGFTVGEVEQQQEQNFPDSSLEPYRRNLVRLAKEGDSDAFARLYDHYVDRVNGFMYLNVANEQTAEDLTARVFLKAWKSIHCYEPDELPFSTWLYMIARDAVMEFSGNRSHAAVKEILSPADEGLQAFERIEPCPDSSAGAIQ